MQAIQTKFICATNTKPSRIKAWCRRGELVSSLSMLQDMTDSQSKASREEDVHSMAALELCKKFTKEDSEKYGVAAIGIWNQGFLTGCLPNGDYAHIFKP